jgi:dTDP-glucose 4,6-dehydratase
VKTILVTGGAGFIGANFVRYVLEHDPGVRVVNLDLLTYAGSLENLKDLPDPTRHSFVQGDICEQDLVTQVMWDYAVDTIVHFAAETHVDRSILGPAAFVRTNVVGTSNLLEAARKAWLDEKTQPDKYVRFHHISTDEVFGSLEPDTPPFNELTRYAPRSPYAASKAASDHLVRAYGYTYGLPATITNCSNNYGPYQFPEKLIPLVISNAINGQPLPIYGDGQQIRDWLHVEDHCEAIYAVLRKGEAGETYLIGGDNQTPNLSIVRTICEIIDELLPASAPHAELIRFVEDRPGHDRRYAVNTDKIKDELGWQPRHTLQDGLLETVRWYLDHPEWVTAIRSQSGYQGWIDKNYAKR